MSWRDNYRGSSVAIPNHAIVSKVERNDDRRNDDDAADNREE